MHVPCTSLNQHCSQLFYTSLKTITRYRNRPVVKMQEPNLQQLWVQRKLPLPLPKPHTHITLRLWATVFPGQSVVGATFVVISQHWNIRTSYLPIVSTITSYQNRGFLVSVTEDRVMNESWKQPLPQLLFTTAPSQLIGPCWYDPSQKSFLPTALGERAEASDEVPWLPCKYMPIKQQQDSEQKLEMSFI